MPIRSVARAATSKPASVDATTCCVGGPSPDRESSRTTAGRTEEIVGAWLKGKRHEFILATKCVGQVGPKPWQQGMSRKHILDAIDASLARLGTDYIDLYQLHGYDRLTPIDEALEALDTAIDIATAFVVNSLLGFHWTLLPTCALEMVPGVDALPTWTACVAYVAWRRKTEQQSLSTS